MKEKEGKKSEAFSDVIGCCAAGLSVGCGIMLLVACLLILVAMGKGIWLLLRM